MVLAGLHHVTCVCSDAQRTTDFYRDRLGFSLVKKTVNFDDPHSYHLYFGDELGSPGTLLTFFEWPRAGRGRLGRGTLESIGLVTPAVSDEQELEDPDGLRLRLFPGERPALHDVVALGNPDLYAGIVAPDAPLLFGGPVEETALVGAGTTHHIATSRARRRPRRARRWCVVPAPTRAVSSTGLRPAAAVRQELEDPDGLRLRLFPGERPALHDVVALGNPDLYAGIVAPDAPLLFGGPVEETALVGAGTTHHIAWRASDDDELATWRARLDEIGLRPTLPQDRKYFHSVYFRMLDGILVEIATDGPGFLVDEPRETLGLGLSLPPWLEADRTTLERELAPIT